jgi:hypothetical protein
MRYASATEGRKGCCAYPSYDKLARLERHFRQGVEHHAHLAVIEAGKQEVGPHSRLDARLHRYSNLPVLYDEPLGSQ